MYVSKSTVDVIVNFMLNSSFAGYSTVTQNVQAIYYKDAFISYMHDILVVSTFKGQLDFFFFNILPTILLFVKD